MQLKKFIVNIQSLHYSMGDKDAIKYKFSIKSFIYQKYETQFENYQKKSLQRITD